VQIYFFLPEDTVQLFSYFVRDIFGVQLFSSLIWIAGKGFLQGTPSNPFIMRNRVPASRQMSRMVLSARLDASRCSFSLEAVRMSQSESKGAEQAAVRNFK
jgi:hypothetical protein